MKTSRRQGPEFLKNHQNRNNARMRKQTEDNEKMMTEIFSSCDTEYLGEFLDFYTRQGKNKIKSVHVNIAYMPDPHRSANNFLLIKLNALFDIMEHNINFVQKALNNEFYSAQQTLFKQKSIHTLRATTKINMSQHSTITNKKYSSFLTTIRYHLAPSVKFNANSSAYGTVLTNAQILSNLLVSIATEKSVSKDEFLVLADRLKLIIRKNMELSDLINQHPLCLRKIYKQCQPPLKAVRTAPNKYHFKKENNQSTEQTI